MIKTVSRFEANLLRLLRGIMEHAPIEQLRPLLAKPMPRPKCLSRAAVELVQDTLAKGCVQFLARHGWKRERFLRDGTVAEGRLWERSRPEEQGLTFSKHSLAFLIRLVSGSLGTAVTKINELSIGDRLLMFLVFDSLRHLENAQELRKNWVPLYQDGLCRLAFLEDLPESAGRFPIDWLTWTTGPGASVLEALQDWLADRWFDVERKKGTFSAVARVRQVGATQARTYGEYLDMLEQAKRRDLARCFLDAAQRLLRDRPDARSWLQNLDVSRVRLADRLAIYHDALAFVRQMERLHEWHQQAVSVGYFDESYAASQLWKADWERLGGEQSWRSARAILREVEPIG